MEVWKQIQTEGWDVVERASREQGATIKGEWKATTQDGNWGANKGEDWKPAAATAEDIEFAATLIAAKPFKEAADKAQEDQAAEVAAAQATVDALIGSSAVDAAERNRLECLITDSNKINLDALNAALADFEDQKIKLEAEKAALPSTDYSYLLCPHEECKRPIKISQFNSAELRIEASHAKLGDETELKARREAFARVDGKLSGVVSLIATARKARDDGKKIVDDAAAARVRIEASVNPQAELDLEVARKALTELRASHERRLRLVLAARLHRRILNNQKWLALLEPDGARKAVLIRKIKPLNDRLRALCEAAQCGTVRIRPDRELEAETDRGTIHYALLSESAAMRADMMMQIVIAERDKSEVILIDRFDKFDGGNRKAAVNALLATGIPSVLGCTYSNDKLPPRLLPPMGRTYWLQEGMARLLDPNEAKAA